MNLRLCSPNQQYEQKGNKNSSHQFSRQHLSTASHFFFPATIDPLHTVKTVPLKRRLPTGTQLSPHPDTQSFHPLVSSLLDPKTWSLVGWPPLGKQGACRAGGTDSGSHISRRTPLPCRRNETPLSPQKEITCRCSNSRLHQHQKVQTNHKPIRRGKNTQFQKECPAPGERKTTA